MGECHVFFCVFEVLDEGLDLCVPVFLEFFNLLIALSADDLDLLFFLYGDCLSFVHDFLPHQMLDLILDGLRPREIFSLDAEGLVGAEQVDHLVDFLAVEVLLVLVFCQVSRQDAGLV